MRFVLPTLLAALLLTSACSSTLEASVEPGAHLTRERTYHVLTRESDAYDVDDLIAAELRRWGRTASAGPIESLPANADVLVTYEDRWFWDITMYMLSLDVQFRDPLTERELARGKSMRTSLVRRSAAGMVEEVLTAVFAQAAPGEGPLTQR